MTIRQLSRAALAIPISLGLSACAGNLGGLGDIGDILGGAMGGGQNQVRAEIQSIDSNRQTIDVITEDNRRGSVRYDGNTQVIYRQQQYPVTALERGDIVVMQIQQGTSGETYVGRIDVEQSVQERSGGSGQLQTVSGSVSQIDRNQGAFLLRTQQGSNITVTLPYNPASQTVDRFNRLRQGDHVTVEGTFISQSRLEIYRFR